ncbi:MAG: M48 family metalloprotease [Gemmatimonadales bacterium]|nr:M48 family metalloprotease [Gemmatimonadales bacterium]MYL06019.1 M48 family metalloprotease [Gemmatimonadales bacterium]
MKDSLLPGFIFLAAISACAKPSTVASDPSPAGIPSVAGERALQTEAAVRTREARLQRLDDVSLPLLRQGPALCGHEVSHFGFRYLARAEVEDEAERDAYRELFGVGERPTIIGVTSGGAAQRAGLVPGDVIVELGGVEVPSGAQGSVEIAFQLVRRRAGEPLPVVVRRGRESVTLEITAERGCDFPIHLSPSDEINASADGRWIQVNAGLLRFLESDQELQLVIAHEMAHNTIGHSAQDREYDRLRGLRGAVRDAAAAAAGGVAPPGEFSQTQEREADYVGMYYLARAGIDTRGVARFWRRMAAEDAAGIRDRGDATHPAYPERFLFLEEVHLEIARKLEAGEPLIPDRVFRRF